MELVFQAHANVLIAFFLKYSISFSNIIVTLIAAVEGHLYRFQISNIKHVSIIYCQCLTSNSKKTLSIGSRLRVPHISKQPPMAVSFWENAAALTLFFNDYTAIIYQGTKQM